MPSAFECGEWIVMGIYCRHDPAADRAHAGARLNATQLPIPIMPDGPAPARKKTEYLSAVLWTVAALLALAPNVLHISRGEPVSWRYIASGLFCAAMAFGVWPRRTAP